MDSVLVPIERRRHLWDRLATDLRPRELGDHVDEVTLEDLETALDGIVAGYKEYAKFAADHGFKVGPENHWGAEGIWPNMQKLYKAIAPHPGFGLSVHMSQWQGTPAEKAQADAESAPWVVAVHMDNDTCNGPLAEKMSLLRNAGYKGWYVVENHSNQRNEYAMTAIQVAQVRTVLQSWRTGPAPTTPPMTSPGAMAIVTQMATSIRRTCLCSSSNGPVPPRAMRRSALKRHCGSTWCRNRRQPAL